MTEQHSASTRTWDEDFARVVGERMGDGASAILDQYTRAFPEAYKEDFSSETALEDIAFLDRVATPEDMELHLYQESDSEPGERRFKVYRRGALTLTSLLPIFTNLGLEVTDERPYEVNRADGVLLHIYDFGLRAKDANVWEGRTEEFENAFRSIWSGRAEDDGFNALVLTAGLSWRQAVILRSISGYIRQIGTPFSARYIEEVMAANKELAVDLVRLFEARFDPAKGGDQAGQDAVVEDIKAKLEQVASLDHDRIIRAFMGVILAALRTNFFQKDENGQPKPYMSLKLDCSKVPGLPLPKPKYEIWVYSKRVEGVHLRFGPVARGGLRWSDRREDFRTEILGLVKAQMVKNAVIVPTGSKGGFFPKQLPDVTLDRDAWLQEGIASYKLFISGLLDITDNRVGDGIEAPKDVVRHDGDDPYLVVAADKGTATFSDIANGRSQDYGFWLDDAFASGGQYGYDHKGMGITAKGAWESVKRHFRELGKDIQTEDFTAVGIGDMSGDVFGNGMLLSEHTRLIAAFDHRHIFIDPNPDAARSFAERKRMFEMPRSTWADYTPELISFGGGVFPLSAKSIPLSAEAKEALGIDPSVTEMSPVELKKAILLAPVELFWNGGIGTYIKASTQNNVEIGDRANDAIRVDGKDIRAKVIGEGGNLGAHQIGRIEAARTGKKVNTDAIDNSAGVDTSDHEVNLKILLTPMVKNGSMSLEDRNALLESMTDDIEYLVLRDNYEQNVLLGNARAHNDVMLPVHARLIRFLEENAGLDRAIEYLPSETELLQLKKEGSGLSSPEFAVLVAYAKIHLKKVLNEGSMTEEPYFAQVLKDYFPKAMDEKFGDQLNSHPLRKEIIVNSVANSMINRGGITFAFRCIEETGATVEQIARAYCVSREVFGMRDFVAQVEELDNKVSTEDQTEIYLEYRRLIDRGTRWFLHNRPATLDVQAEIDRFKPVYEQLVGQIESLLQGSEKERYQAQVEAYKAQGVPEELARRTAGLLDSFSILDIAQLASETGKSAEDVAATYFALSEHFAIDALLTHVASLPTEDRWDSLARGAMRDDVYSAWGQLTESVIKGSSDGKDGAGRISEWREQNAEILDKGRRSLAAVKDMERPGIAPISVALRTLRGLIRQGAAK